MVRTTEKSLTAFRTISEVSTELDIPQHVLRFWEGKFSNLKPLKRAGGRRYYRPEDLELLKRIRGLLYDEGYTIKGVQKLIREGALREPSHGEGAAAAVMPSSESHTQSLDDAQQEELLALRQELVALRDQLKDCLRRR